MSAGGAGGTLDDVNRRRLLLASIGGAAIIAGALIGALALSSGGSSKHTSTTPVGVGRVAAMLHGIPQHGEVLGSPKAPVTLLEFADPQCPYCADWAKTSLPTIVRRYVRPGKVQIVFNGMAFVGPDSDAALRAALAAGRQNRFWNVIELLYENQGGENSGWVTDSLLRSIGESVPGLDPQRMLADRTSKAVEEELVSSQAFAQQSEVSSTPTFAVGRTGSQLQLVQIQSIEPSALTPSLDAALGQ